MIYLHAARSVAVPRLTVGEQEVDAMNEFDDSRPGNVDEAGSGPTGLRRRDLLRQGTVAAVGVGLLGSIGLRAGEVMAESDAAAGPARVRRYVELGKTGLKMPDISFGTGSLADPELIAYAYDRGMTYFDTAEGYPMSKPGLAEKAIAKVLKGKRNEVVLASKQVTKPNDKRAEMMRRLDNSLKRLQTDRIDVYFNHAVNDVARMKSPEWADFIALAKQQGKIRFSGMSGHGGHLKDALSFSLDNDLVDVILAAYNFGQDPAFYESLTKSFDMVANQTGLPPILAKAQEKGVGVIAMKTLMGARLNDMKPYERAGGQYSQAAFRWVLSNPDVDGLIVTMKSREMIDEYLAASGTGAVQKSDVELLRQYAALNGSTQCRPGCGECVASCPYGVEIDDVLRARMYSRDYANPEQGRAAYAQLTTGASACLSCANPTCADACSYGLDIPKLTRTAAELFVQS
ncbi:MAG: aldo/keto reductase [Deltaproteobacteria bacterium]|nr:aldo/keto reductase [Deltaproteobacteria bacterium]